MYLYITEDGSFSQQLEEPTHDDLENVDQGGLDILRWNGKQFEYVVVQSEEAPDDEDDEDSDTHEEYSIASWSRV